jgi:hypothetical protein
LYPVRDFQIASKAPTASVTLASSWPGTRGYSMLGTPKVVAISWMNLGGVTAGAVMYATALLV